MCEYQWRIWDSMRYMVLKEESELQHAFLRFSESERDQGGGRKEEEQRTKNNTEFKCNKVSHPRECKLNQLATPGSLSKRLQPPERSSEETAPTTCSFLPFFSIRRR